MLLEEGECFGKTGPFIGFFILDFIRCFVLHAPPAGLRDKVQDKEHDKGKAKVASNNIRMHPMRRGAPGTRLKAGLRTWIT